MFTSIRNFFDQFIDLSADTSDADPSHKLRLATAALLLEMERADFDTDTAERELLIKLLKAKFELTDEEIEQLIVIAEQEANDSTCLFELTRLIDQHYQVEDKLHVLEMLWQVAYADNRLDKYEEYLVRKIADLLHLSHRQLIQAKHKVCDAQPSRPEIVQPTPKE